MQVLQSQVENIGKPVTGPMPTGCDSVKALGWTQSAFYTVKGSGGKKINTVYCDFSKKTGMTGYEALIGYNDVKTSDGVYFYVQRDLEYLRPRNVIPYTVERLNNGNAMSTYSGAFYAPVNGHYHFSFSAHAKNTDTWVAIRLNNVYTAISGCTSYGTLSVTVTLNLKKGDRIDTYLDAGSLSDDKYHYTMFSGILLEQDLIFQ